MSKGFNSLPARYSWVFPERKPYSYFPVNKISHLGQVTVGIKEI